MSWVGSSELRYWSSLGHRSGESYFEEQAIKLGPAFALDTFNAARSGRGFHFSVASEVLAVYADGREPQVLACQLGLSSYLLFQTCFTEGNRPTKLDQVNGW